MHGPACRHPKPKSDPSRLIQNRTTWYCCYMYVSLELQHLEGKLEFLNKKFEFSYQFIFMFFRKKKFRMLPSSASSFFHLFYITFYIAFQITHLFCCLSSLQTQISVNKGWGWDFEFKNIKFFNSNLGSIGRSLMQYAKILKWSMLHTCSLIIWECKKNFWPKTLRWGSSLWPGSECGGLCSTFIHWTQCDEIAQMVE